MKEAMNFRPLYDDILFKEGFARKENRLYLEYFLETLLDLPRGTFHNKLRVRYESPIEKKNYTDKALRADLLIDYLDYTINIECFSKFDTEAFDKTMCYAFRLASDIKRGKRYNKIKKIIQIVIIKNLHMKFSKKSFNKYLITNVNNVKDVLSKEKFQLYYYRLDYLDNVQAYSYNDTIKLRLLRFIKAESKDERKRIAKGDELLMQFDENLNEYVMDENTKRFFAEWDWEIYQHQAQRAERKARRKGLKEGRKKGLEQGRKKGIEQGIEQGIKQSCKAIAKNLLNKGMDLSFIEETTGIKKVDLQQLVNQQTK